MRDHLQTFSFAVCASLMLLASVSRASNFSQFLHAAFNDQMGRAPTGTELYHHANIARANGPLESYIQMCASDDYFITRAQHDMEVYVTRLYQTFVGRNPRPDEVRFWVNQFQQSNVDRVVLVRRFCQVNHVTQLPGLVPSRPVFVVPTRAAAIAAQLVSRLNLFISLVQTELGGSFYGRDVLAQARRLLTAAEQYRQLLGAPGTTGQQIQIAADNVETTLQALEREYHRVPGASVHCQAVLQQISQLTTAARGAAGSRAPPVSYRPPAMPAHLPATPGSEYAPARAAIDALLNAMRQFVYGMQSYKDESPFYGSLYRDLQSLSVQVEAIALLNRQRQSERKMR